MWNKMASSSIFLCLGCIIFVTSVSGQVAVSNVTCSNLQLQEKTWNLTGFCSATLYGEASYGNCYWDIERNNNTKDVRTLIVPGHVQRIAEGEFLWNCFLSNQFPYTNGSFDISIHFYLQSVKLEHAFYLTLEPPVLELPSCPAYVTEGESLNCTCRLMNNPKPSPLLWWDDSHDHREVGPVFLSKDKVNRDQNGESYSCHAKWSNETVSKSFTLNVAYGPDPDQVSVEKIQLSNISVVEVIDLRCTAQEVYPGVTFTWNVPCLNTTINKESSDCTYHLAPEDNGKTVECTATNNFTNISQHASYTLTYTVVVTQETTHSLSITTALPETTETTEKQNDGVPILYIAVGAGCGFVVIVLCVTVICCMRRRNQDKDGVRFRGGVIRQSIKPTAVAARILQDPEGDKAAIVVDDFEDDVPSNDPVAKQAQSVIYDILNKRKKEVQFAEKLSSNLAYAQNQRNEPEKQTTGPTVSAVSATVFRTDSEEEAVTRL